MDAIERKDTQATVQEENKKQENQERETEIYRDSTRGVSERARDLVSRMTLEEKANQLRYDAPGIERLGIPRYNWWNEALHGVARAGTATVFPQAIGMAAMFSEELLQEVADVIATEARAKYNGFSSYGDRDIYKGLTMWSPNINIFRDPRWGRGQETYGEDPYLTARLGVAFVKGLQGDGKYLKTAACAKHFAVHSGPEGLRHEFDAQVSKKDMAETYLPAFEACVQEAKVEAVMGAYNRLEGEPCCGSPFLLRELLREKWGFAGHVVSDCGAIKDFHRGHLVTGNATESAALALKSGCDLNCGNVYLLLLAAHQEGLVTEEEITAAAERLMATRIRLGLLDEDCEYNDIDLAVVDSAPHAVKNLETARRSMVLLKNDGVLPLNPNMLRSIAVIGPNADNRRALYGNYSGTASGLTTVLEGIRQAAGEQTRIHYAEGCHLHKERTEALALPDDRLTEAVLAAHMADVVVLCLGLDPAMEGEEGDAAESPLAGDRADLHLPATQRKLLEAVTMAGKPVILVLLSGGALAVEYAEEHCGAILQAWYPGSRGGEAVADLLFGKCSPSGKLPVTFYRNAEDLPEFGDYAMKGRTYRYLEKECLYPFGYGLTYSKVQLSRLQAPASGKAGEDISVRINLSNRGSFAVEEVVQCYIKDLESAFAVPNHSLCAFQRVSLPSGVEREIALTIPARALEVVNENGDRILDSRRFHLSVGLSQPDERSVELCGVKPLSFEYRIEEGSGSPETQKQ